MGKYGKFHENPAGLGALLRSPEMQNAVRRPAERVKAAAEATAPVGDPAQGDTHPGLYRDSFSEVKVTVEATGKGGVRAVAHVVNTAPHAVAVEYGTSHSPAHHTLGRALDAAGG